MYDIEELKNARARIDRLIEGHSNSAISYDEYWACFDEYDAARARLREASARFRDVGGDVPRSVPYADWKITHERATRLDIAVRDQDRTMAILESHAATSTREARFWRISWVLVTIACAFTTLAWLLDA